MGIFVAKERFLRGKFDKLATVEAYSGGSWGPSAPSGASTLNVRTCMDYAGLRGLPIYQGEGDGHGQEWRWAGMEVGRK